MSIGDKNNYWSVNFDCIDSIYLDHGSDFLSIIKLFLFLNQNFQLFYPLLLEIMYSRVDDKSLVGGGKIYFKNVKFGDHTFYGQIDFVNQFGTTYFDIAYVNFNIIFSDDYSTFNEMKESFYDLKHKKIREKTFHKGDYMSTTNLDLKC